MSEVSVRQSSRKVENLYFQFVLVHLLPRRVQLAQGEEIKLAINRGKQLFEETKGIKVNHQDGHVSLGRTKLNFIVFTYDPSKLYEFSLKVSRISHQEETPIGEYFFDCNSYIDTYLQSSNGAFQDQFVFLQDLQVKLEIYVEKSRYGLERLVREMTNGKSKIMEQLGTRAYQRITERKVRSTSERSVSPRKRRESPLRRVSPVKERQQFSTTPKVEKEVEEVKVEKITQEVKLPEVKETEVVTELVEKTAQPVIVVVQPQIIEKQEVLQVEQEHREPILPKQEELPLKIQQKIEVMEAIPTPQPLIIQQAQNPIVEEVKEEKVKEEQPQEVQQVLPRQIKAEEPIIQAKQQQIIREEVPEVVLPEPVIEVSPTQQAEILPKLRQFPFAFKISFAILIFLFLVFSNYAQDRPQIIHAHFRGNSTSTNTTEPVIAKKPSKALPSKKKKGR